MSIFSDLARNTVETYVTQGKIPTAPDPLPPQMALERGTFVSIHEKNGDLRGCIGTIAPTQPNLALEIIQNAISAATQDPRFPPVDTDELPGLEYSVDVLSEPEPIADLTGHDPKKYGLIIEAGWRRGLLLPDLEGVDSAEEQFRICCQKGDIDPHENVALSRFTVERYT